VTAESRADIIIDTSSLQGHAGAFDIEFNPDALDSPTASAVVTNFNVVGGSVSNPMPEGNVSGSLLTSNVLPGNLTIKNDTASSNDLLMEIVYGSQIRFTLNFTGGSGEGPDGSIFGVFLFSDPAGTVPVQTTDTVNSTVVTTTVTPGIPSPIINTTQYQIIGQPSSVPEPSPMMMGSLGLILAGALRFARRSGAWRSREITGEPRGGGCSA
jgi:hypothetical protein